MCRRLFLKDSPNNSKAGWVGHSSQDFQRTICINCPTYADLVLSVDWMGSRLGLSTSCAKLGWQNALTNATKTVVVSSLLLDVPLDKSFGNSNIVVLKPECFDKFVLHHLGSSKIAEYAD